MSELKNPTQNTVWKKRLKSIALGFIFSVLFILILFYSFETYLKKSNPDNFLQVPVNLNQWLNPEKPHLARLPDDFIQNSVFGHFPQFPAVIENFAPLRPILNPQAAQKITLIPKNPFKKFPPGAFRLACMTYQEIRGTEETNKITINATYNIEENYCRRIIPNENTKSAEKIKRGLIILGDSQIFGQGISDSETLPAQLSQKKPDVRFYNYAMAGLYPGEMLDRIKLIGLNPQNHEITESKNTLVIFYSDYHIYRSVSSLREIANWGYYRPYYFKDSTGQIVQTQSIKKALPIRSWFADHFVKSRTASYFNLNWPNVTEADWEFYIDLLKQIQQNSVRLGVDKFYVIIYPNQLATTTELIRHLETAGIHYISYADWDIQKLSTKPTTLENDGHSNGEFNKIFAQTLSEQEYLYK